MTKKIPHRHRDSPNRLPVSPKRGFAAAASSFGQQHTSPDIEGTTDDFKNVTAAGTSPSSSPLSSSASRSEHQTQSSRPTTFSSLPSAEEIRNRRAWTVARTLSTSGDGSKITVQWKDTAVPHKRISTDKDQRASIRADGMKHYIAKRSKGGVDSTGRAMWNVKWEPSTIPKEWMEDLDVEEDEEAEEREEHQAESEAESEHGSPASDSSDYSIGPNTPSSSRTRMSSETDTDSESEVELTPSPSPSPASSSDVRSTPSLPSNPLQLPSLNSSPSKPRQSIESAEEAQQAEKDSTALPILDDLPKAYIESLHFPVTSDTADYGPAVRKLIAAKAGNELSTSTNAIPQVIRPRLGKEPVRPLQFKKWTVNRAGHSINLKDTQNAEAVMVHMQGQEVAVPCRRCAEERGVMQGCVVMEGFGKGECTNCHYGGSSRRCCFRQDNGYRPAVLLEYPAASRHSQANRPIEAASEKEDAAGGGETAEHDATSSSPFRMPSPGQHDFVSDSDRYRSGTFRNVSSSSGDDFIMSGGLGKLTVTPSPKAKTTLPRARSRSTDISEDGNVSMSKKPRLERLDLPSSHSASQPRGWKKKKKSPKKQTRRKTLAEKESEQKRRPTTYTPPSSPLLPPTEPQKRPKPAPTFRPLKPLLEPDQIVAQQRLSGTTADQYATAAAKSTTTNLAATSSSARLKERKQQAAPSKADLPSSLQKEVPATAKSNGPGSHATSSAEPSKERKQQDQDKPVKSTVQSGTTSGTTPSSKSDEHNSTSVSGSAHTSSSAVAKPAADAPTSHPPAPKPRAPIRPTPSSTSTSQASKPTAPGSAPKPDVEASKPISTLNLPELALELNCTRRAIAANELAAAVAKGEVRERERRAAKKAARKKRRKQRKDQTKKSVEAGKPQGKRGPPQPDVSGSVSRSLQQREKPTKPTKQPIRVLCKPKTSPDQPPTTRPYDTTNTSPSDSKATFPDPAHQSLPIPFSPNNASSLTTTQFSHLFHHAPASLRGQMLRLLRWAWHEGRVGREVRMADFFCSREGREERAWLMREWAALRGGEGGFAGGEGKWDGDGGRSKGSGKGKEKIAERESAGIDEKRKSVDARRKRRRVDE